MLWRHRPLLGGYAQKSQEHSHRRFAAIEPEDEFIESKMIPVSSR